MGGKKNFGSIIKGGNRAKGVLKTKVTIPKMPESQTAQVLVFF